MKATRSRWTREKYEEENKKYREKHVSTEFIKNYGPDIRKIDKSPLGEATNKKYDGCN